MAQATKIVAALQILQKYGPVNVDAEHDVIYAGLNDGALVSDVDALVLEELGWHFDKGAESWARFT